jgi:GNAT superfamily N-acetyltransferase
MPILLAIGNEAYANSYEFTPFTEDDIFRGRPGDIVVVAERENEVIGFALLEFRTRKGETEADISILAVTGNAENVEKLLVDECEKVCGTKVITHYLPPDDKRITWLTQRGYVVEPGYCHFVAPLEELPPQPTVNLNGFQVRSMTSSEEAEVIRVVNASYGHERITKFHFERWMKQDPLFNDDWVLLATVDGKITAVACSRQDLRYNQTYNKRRGYLGPGCTLPEFRSKGINKALNWYGMKFLRDKGMQEVSLETAEANEPIHKLAADLGYQRRFVWKRLRKTLQL